MSPQQESREYGFWAVAFLDLLGQQEAFLGSDFPPGSESQEPPPSLLSALADTLGVVELFHNLAAEFATSDGGSHILAPGSPLLNLPAEVQALPRAWKKANIRHSAWSDGVAFYLNLAPSEEHFPITALFNVVAVSGLLALLQLSSGKPIRGGLDIGTGIAASGQLFGAAVVKAYQLESKHAGYPRILVGDALVRYLSDVPRPSEIDISGQYRKLEAQKTARMLVQDEDGRWMIDFLGDQFRSLTDNDEDTRRVFRRAYAFVNVSAKKWKNAGDTKLAPRYEALRRYFSRNVAAWEAG